MPGVLIDLESLAMMTMQHWTEGQSEPPPPDVAAFLEMALRNYDGLVHLTRGDSDLRMREVAAKALFGRGLALMLLRRPGADGSYREAVATYEALLARSPDRPDYAFGKAASLRYLCASLFKHGSGDRAAAKAAADPVFAQLAEYERGLVERHPGSADFRSYRINDLLNWAHMLAPEGWIEESARVLAEVLQIDPANPGALLLWGKHLADRGRRPEAIKAWEAAVEAAPKDAQVINGAAWYMVSRPDPSHREAARGLELAERAVSLAGPKSPAALWNTLGVARLRNGRPDAAEAFEHSLQGGSSGKQALDWFPLAIVYARRGDAEKARKYYDQAVEWTRLYAPGDPEVGGFQSEARAALGLPEAQAPAPARAGGPAPVAPAATG